MITIDARWINTSGIGTYIKNVLPGIIYKFPQTKFSILGNIIDLRELFDFDESRVSYIQINSPMYSIHEQIEYVRLIPKETKLYFATHYNIPIFFNGKMLVTVYDLFHLAMPKLVGGMHKRLYARYMFNRVRKKADAIVTISNFSKSELIRFTGSGNQQIFPIHLGVDRSWFSIPESESPHSRPYILYVGNIKPHKNLVGLIKAYKKISKQIKHDLVLVGKKEGFITGDCNVELEANGLHDRVYFTGRVDDHSLKRYFSHADMFVFPSLYEGFGLPPLEAMASGCPVLASNAGPMPEICGDAVLYCDPYDISDIAEKMSTLLQDKKLAETLKKRGLNRASTFTWERCINETCEVISSLTQN